MNKFLIRKVTCIFANFVMEPNSKLIFRDCYSDHVDAENGGALFVDKDTPWRSYKKSPIRAEGLDFLSSFLEIMGAGLWAILDLLDPKNGFWII